MVLAPSPLGLPQLRWKSLALHKCRGTVFAFHTRLGGGRIQCSNWGRRLQLEMVARDRGDVEPRAEVEPRRRFLTLRLLRGSLLIHLMGIEANRYITLKPFRQRETDC